jgi:hypothetical protein
MLRRSAARYALLFFVLIGPLGLGCGAPSDTAPAPTSTAEDVEVPTVELPEDSADPSQETVGE